MARNQGTQLDLTLNRASQQSLDKYLERLGQIEKSFQELISLQKKLGDTSKALNAKAVAGNLDGYIAGEDAAIKRRVARKVVGGTARGIRLGDSREDALVADQMVRASKEQVRNAEAAALAVRRLRQETKTATDLQALKNQLQLAERRLGLELASNDRRRISDAKLLVDATRQRINQLTTEQAALKEAVKYEEQRLGAIARQDKARAAEAARQPKAIAERGRLLTNERLFGDGGAGLLGVQAGLGANYMLLNTVRTTLAESITFSVDLDASLRNLQSIVVTTDAGLKALRETVTSVAERTRFSAVELADAAIILGQAGLSLQQIDSAIEAVALLATATGTDLKQAVDVTTSVLGVFNLEAGQTAQVANVLTEAVNSSKLDIEKLALGLQYSGNTAAESGLGFEELTAALGAMSNAGIRSGSTLGTGMRQILISLQKPSKEFLATLDRLGLTMADVDVRTNGLYGAMDNLQKAGFTAADAIRSFEVRGAAAYTALSKNLDQMLEMETSFYDTTASVKANETQMRSLQNQALRFNNTLKALVSSGLEPLLYFTRDVFKGMADLLGSIDQTGVGVKVLTVGFASLIAVGIGAWLLKLTGGLALALAGSQAMATGLLALKFAIASIQMGSLPLLLTALAPLTPVLIGIGAVLGLSALAWNSYANEVALGKTAIAEAEAKLEESTGVVQAYADQITTVNVKLQELRDRQAVLEGDSRLLRATVRAVKGEFAAMGLDVKNVEETVDGLISSLETLQDRLSKEYILKLRVQQQDQESLRDLAVGGKARALAGIPRVNNALIGPDGSVSKPLAFVDESLAENADPGIDELKALKSRLSAFIGDSLTTPGGTSKAQQFFIEQAQKTLAGIDEALRFAQEINQLDLDLEKNLNGQETAENTQSPEFLAIKQKIEAERQRFTTRSAEIQKYYSGDAMGQASAMQALVDSVERNVTTRLEEIDGLTGFTEDARELLEGMANDLLVVSTPAAGAAQENAKPVAAVRADLRVEELEKAQDKLLGQLEDATSFTQIEQLVAASLETETAYYEALLAQAEAGTDGSSGEIQAAQERQAADSEARLAGQRETAAAARRRLIKATATGIMNTATDRFGRVMEDTRQAQQDVEIGRATAKYGADSAQVENLRIGYARQIYAEKVRELAISNELKKALMAIFDLENKRRNPVQERNAKAMQQYGSSREASRQATLDIEKTNAELQKQIGLQRLIAIFGEDSAIVSKARVEAEREIYKATLDTNTLSGPQIEAHMKLWDLANGVTNATWGWADAMAGVAAQVNGILGALSQLGGGLIGNASRAIEIRALKAGKTAAEARRAVEENQIEVESNARAAGAGNWMERALVWADKRTRLFGLKQEEELDVLRANAPTGAKPSGAGGPGGGSGGSPFENYMATLQGNLGAATTARDGVAFNDLIQAAKAEADKRAKQIEYLQGQTLSAAKQKELNQLVEEHRELTGFIEDAQQRSIQNGKTLADVQLNLNQRLRDFSDTNLNMSETLDGGLTSAFSSWKSGLGSFFAEVTAKTKSGKDAFLGFAAAVVRSLHDVAAEMLAVHLMQNAIGMLGSGSGGGFLSKLFGAVTGQAPLTVSGGGRIPRMDRGGLVEGTMARDSVHALLMPDEFVLRKSAVDMIGVENLEHINAMGNRSATRNRAAVAGVGRSSGNERPLNIWVAPPDQRPIPGPNDIIAVVTDDMARGGATKKLIKRIQQGVG